VIERSAIIMDVEMYLKSVDHNSKDRRLGADNYFVSFPGVWAVSDGDI
jgi:hypothetical protein